MKKDIDLTLNKNPITNNINSITGYKRINQQLKNILLLKDNDFKYRDDFGKGLYGQIGETVTPGLIAVIKEKTREIIINNINEIELIDIVVKFSFTEQSLLITIKYALQNTPEIIDFTISVRVI